MFTVSDDWKKAYPGAFVGVIAMSGVSNPTNNADMDRKKQDLEEDLRAGFKDKSELRSTETLQAYKKYYKRFKKTYHVQQQLESVIFKGKSIPSVAALVEAMFAAELKNMLLTAGHDLDVVEPPLRLDTAKEGDSFEKMNGQEQALKAGDMIISDSKAVISSVIYGPDKRTRIVPGTRNVMFTVYAAPGVPEQTVFQHLRDLEANVKLIAPDANTDLMEVYAAD